MSEFLPPSECIAILQGRLSNLKRGSGDYSRAARAREISDALDTLEAAERDLRKDLLATH